MQNKKNENGQSLLEVVIAISVGIFVVAALTFATIFSLRNANFAKNSAQATKLAQQGIEMVRIGRNRNATISNLPASNVVSWNGNSSSNVCTENTAVKLDSLWCYRITQSGGCNDTSTEAPCYLNVDPNSGALNSIAALSLAEGIPSSNPVFNRVVLLSDEPSNYTSQKKVTVIVSWKDATGDHESKLMTVLGRI